MKNQHFSHGLFVLLLWWQYCRSTTPSLDNLDNWSVVPWECDEALLLKSMTKRRRLGMLQRFVFEQRCQSWASLDLCLTFLDIHLTSLNFHRCSASIHLESLAISRRREWVGSLANREFYFKNTPNIGWEYVFWPLLYWLCL